MFVACFFRLKVQDKDSKKKYDEIKVYE